MSKLLSSFFTSKVSSILPIFSPFLCLRFVHFNASITAATSILGSLPILFFSGAYSASNFTVINNCSYTIWPAILSRGGRTQLPTSGFVLQNGKSRTIQISDSWVGTIWGRTSCSQDSTANFSCITGDCGSGKLECSSLSTTPTTLGEFAIKATDSSLVFYDVSFVDGYNLPIIVEPISLSETNCKNIGCATDLNDVCPTELQMEISGGDVVACKSACEALAQEKYCCTEAYNSRDTCKPTLYSEVFKKACPTAYSYAFDDATSTFTCAVGADYVITFCPSPTNIFSLLKSSFE